MKNLNFLIKPASSLCNMRCRYCFYEDEAVNRTEASTGRMTTETVDCLFNKPLLHWITGTVAWRSPFREENQHLLGWITTVILLKRFTSITQITSTWNFAFDKWPDVDEQWAVFLAANRFLVGISIDGTKALHDELRPDAFGRSTWARVTKALSLLQKNKVDTNILCVVYTVVCKKPWQSVSYASETWW